MRKLFLHVGMHKTATTSLQVSLEAGTAILNKNGVHRLMTGVPPMNSAHHNLAWQITQDPRHRHDWGTLRDLIDELESSHTGGTSDVLITSEEFECSISRRPEGFRQFVAEVARRGFEVVVVTYLRNQVDYVRSLYFELLKHGLPDPFDVFARKCVERGFVTFKQQVFALDYDSFLRQIQDIPSVTLVVRSYDSTKGAILEDFLRVIGPDADWSGMNTNIYLNRTLSVAESFGLFCRNRNVDQLDVPGVLDLLGGDHLIDMSLDSRRAFQRAFAPGNAKVEQGFGLVPFIEEEGREPYLSLNHIFSAEFVELFRRYSAVAGSHWTAVSQAHDRRRDELASQKAVLDATNAELGLARTALHQQAAVQARLEEQHRQALDQIVALQAELDSRLVQIDKPKSHLPREPVSSGEPHWRSKAAALDAVLESEQQLHAASLHTAALEAKIQTWSRLVETLTADAERDHNELAASADRVRALEATLEARAEELQEAATIRTALEGQLAERNLTISVLEGALAKNQASLENSMFETASERDACSRLAADLGNLRTEIATLERELAGRNAELAEARTTKDRLVGQMAELVETAANLQNESAGRTELERRLAEQTALMEALVAEAERNRAAAETFAIEIERLREVSDVLEVGLIRERELAASKDDWIALLEAEVNSIGEALEVTRTEFHAWRQHAATERESERQAVDGMKAENEELHSSLREYKRLFALEQSTTRRLQGGLETLKKAADTEQRDLKRVVSELTLEIQRREKLEDRAKVEVAQLMKKLEAAREENGLLEDSLRDLQARLRLVESNVERAETEAIGLRDARANAEVGNCSLRNQIEELRDQVARLKEEVRQEGACVTQLTSDLAAIRRSTSWRVTAPIRAVRRMFASS